MDQPPPYCEEWVPFQSRFDHPKSEIKWQEITPLINPENISPEVFHALNMLVKHYTEKSLIMIDRSGGFPRTHAPEKFLQFAQMYWRIVQIFSESILFLRPIY
jgi:hypothetical protein